MKKIIIIGAAIAVVSIGGVLMSTNNNQITSGLSISQETKTELISKEEFTRMSEIIAKVNRGELPVSALKDAEPLLKRSPEYLSKKINYSMTK